MTPLQRFAAGATVAALLASATACTKDDPVTAPTISATAIATPTASAVVTPTVTPTPRPTLSQRAQAEADAIAMVKKYYAVTDGLGQKPGTRKAAEIQLRSVAVSTELAFARDSIDSIRDDGMHQTGSVRVYKVKVRQTQLEFRPKSKPPVIPTVAIDLCAIVAGVDLIDKEGKSHVVPGRLPRIVTHARVSNYEWPNRNGWRVSSYTTEDKEC